MHCENIAIMGLSTRQRTRVRCTFCTVVEGGKVVSSCSCGGRTEHMQAKAWRLVYTCPDQVDAAFLIQSMQTALQDRFLSYYFPVSRMSICGGQAVKLRKEHQDITVRIVVVLDYAVSWSFLQDIFFSPWDENQNGVSRGPVLTWVGIAVVPSLCDWQIIFVSMAETLEKNVKVTLCGDWMGVASILDTLFCCDCGKGLVDFLYRSAATIDDEGSE